MLASANEQQLSWKPFFRHPSCRELTERHIAALRQHPRQLNAIQRQIHALEGRLKKTAGEGEEQEQEQGEAIAHTMTKTQAELECHVLADFS